jgi:hypothetical protein
VLLAAFAGGRNATTEHGTGTCADDIEKLAGAMHAGREFWGDGLPQSLCDRVTLGDVEAAPEEFLAALMDASGLTERERKILRFILEALDASDRTPTQDAVAAGVGCSIRSVGRSWKAIKEKAVECAEHFEMTTGREAVMHEGLRRLLRPMTEDEYRDRITGYAASRYERRRAGVGAHEHSASVVPLRPSAVAVVASESGKNTSAIIDRRAA